MKRAAIASLLLIARVSAQAIVPPADLLRVQKAFEPRPDEERLPCYVTPIRPVINLAFRTEAGYTFRVPKSQYSGPTAGWMVLTAIAPEHGDPTYLLGRTRFTDAPVVESDFAIRGAYSLGTGRYSVEATLRDDRNRVCRQHWQIVVSLSHSERSVPLAVPPLTVRELQRINIPDVSHPDDVPPMRLSVLVSAAAFSTRRMSIVPDIERIAGALTALLEHLPASSVRLVAFSLEQRKEIFRAESFHPDDILKLADAIESTPRATVDVSLLKTPRGYVDFLAGVIRREFAAPDRPADTVIFLGPESRYWDKIPREALPAAGQAHPRLYYVRDEGFHPPVLWESQRGIPTARLTRSGHQPDIISRAVAQLNGAIVNIYSPAELAAAIRRIEGRR